MRYQVNTLKKDSKRVNIVLKLVNRLEPRYAKGHKITTFLAADATGAILVPFWNDDGNTVQVGDVLEIQNGYVSEFREKIQLNVGKFGNFKKVDPPENFAVNPDIPLDTEDSEASPEDPIALEDFYYQKKARAPLRLFVQERLQDRTVHTKHDGQEHKVATFLVGDMSGCMLLNAWDAHIAAFAIGTMVQVTHAYIRTFQKRQYLSLTRTSGITSLPGTIKINCQHNLSDLAMSAQGE